MAFEWDEGKARSNLRKHGVDFADAAAIFDDDLAMTIPDPHSDDERFITIGHDGFGRLLVVVYTWRDDSIRIISARTATARERKEREKG